MVSKSEARPLDKNLAERTYAASLFFSDSVLEELNNHGKLEGSTYSRHINDLNSSISNINDAVNPKKYTNKEPIDVIFRSVWHISNALESMAAELVAIAENKISIKKMLLIEGIANSKGIEHLNMREIIEELETYGDGRIFEVSPDGVVRSVKKADYDPVALRKELTEIHKIEDEIDSHTPIYADALNLPQSTKRMLALQEAINFGKLPINSYLNVLEMAEGEIKYSFKKGSIPKATEDSILRDIEGIKQVLYLSFSVQPPSSDFDSVDSGNLAQKSSSKTSLIRK
ncbi:MAG: hypothetical protein QXN59_03065 [Candidatus Micrarchaeaceae archaeon]